MTAVNALGVEAAEHPFLDSSTQSRNVYVPDVFFLKKKIPRQKRVLGGKVGVGVRIYKKSSSALKAAKDQRCEASCQEDVLSFLPEIDVAEIDIPRLNSSSTKAVCGHALALPQLSYCLKMRTSSEACSYL